MNQTIEIENITNRHLALYFGKEKEIEPSSIVHLIPKAKIIITINPQWKKIAITDITLNLVSPKTRGK